ncbi:hypothetical protein Dimus_013170 [Dionaea muscipula]
MTVIHLKKKDVVKSSVKGIGIEFDHERLASILSIPGNNGICEYVKDVWEESKRRDDDMDNPEEEAEKEDEGNKDGFDWEAMIDEAVVEGNTAREKSFMMLRIRIDGSQEVRRDSTTTHKVQLGGRNKVLQSRPSCPTGENSRRCDDQAMTRI